MSSRAADLTWEGLLHVVRHPVRSLLTAMTSAIAIAVTVNVISLSFGFEEDIPARSKSGLKNLPDLILCHCCSLSVDVYRMFSRWDRLLAGVRQPLGNDARQQMLHRAHTKPTGLVMRVSAQRPLAPH